LGERQHSLEVHKFILCIFIFIGNWDWAVGRWTSTKHLVLRSSLGCNRIWGDGRWDITKHLVLRSWSCDFILRITCRISLRVGLGILLGCFCFLTVCLIVCKYCVHTFRNLLKNMETFFDTVFNCRLVFLDLVHDISSDMSSFLGLFNEFRGVKIKLHELNVCGVLKWALQGL